MIKIIAYYSVILGVSILGLWIIILTGDGMPEGPVESTFHLLSEFLMAALCILGGILTLIKRDQFNIVIVAAHAMVIYSVLNAAGYYGQNSGLAIAVPFVCLAVISALVIIIFLTTKDPKGSIKDPK